MIVKPVALQLLRQFNGMFLVLAQLSITTLMTFPRIAFVTASSCAQLESPWIRYTPLSLFTRYDVSAFRL